MVADRILLSTYSAVRHPAAAQDVQGDEFAAFYALQEQHHSWLLELVEQITEHKLTSRSTADAWANRAGNYATQHHLMQQQQKAWPYPGQGCIGLELRSDVAYTARMAQAAWAMSRIADRRAATARRAALLAALSEQTTDTLTPTAAACVAAVNRSRRAQAPPGDTDPPRGLSHRPVLSRCAAAAAPPIASCTHHERLLSTA